jgi:hypothetical protein
MVRSSDNPDLLLSIRKVGGRSGEPVARLTPLGWTCVGPLSQTSEVYQVNHVDMYHGEIQDQELSVEEQMQILWNIDVATPSSTSQHSPDEQLALRKAKQSVVLKEGRYEIGIPWKEDHPCLPNNRSMAERRFFS